METGVLFSQMRRYEHGMSQSLLWLTQISRLLGTINFCRISIINWQIQEGGLKKEIIPMSDPSQISACGLNPLRSRVKKLLHIVNSIPVYKRIASPIPGTVSSLIRRAFEAVGE